MIPRSTSRAAGFTLLEVLAALLVLSALALLSYRGLDAVLTARDRVTDETAKWLQLHAFITRFKQDVQVAAPYPAFSVDGMEPAWTGRQHRDGAADPLLPSLEFSRFASVEGQDRIRRIAYMLDDEGVLELWLWPSLDTTTLPARYPVLEDVVRADFEYLSAGLSWSSVWPLPTSDTPIPRAVRLTLELGTGEVLVRVFALGT